MKLFLHTIISLYVVVHGILESSRFFWQGWIIEFGDPPIWPAISVIIIGLIFLVYPFLQLSEQFPSKQLFWVLGAAVVLVELWFMIEPLRIGELHPTLIMSVLSVIGIVFLCVTEKRGFVEKTI